jgi:hypothetical protein
LSRAIPIEVQPGLQYRYGIQSCDSAGLPLITHPFVRDSEMRESSPGRRCLGKRTACS